MMATMNERTKPRFTREDGEKLMWRVKDIEISQDTFNEKVNHEFGNFRIEMSKLSMQVLPRDKGRFQSVAHSLEPEADKSAQVIRYLQSEVHHLRAEINRLHRMVTFNRSHSHHPMDSTQAILASPAAMSASSSVQR